MPSTSKIYTRTGDDGTTGLGTGRRVRKACPRIEAYGTVDELNAQIGAALAAKPVDELVVPLRRIQGELLCLGADLCAPEADKPRRRCPRIDGGHVEAIEQLVDQLDTQLRPLRSFVLPGGTPVAAALHVARTVCRRAERAVVALAEQEPVTPDNIRYLNRLSDALFVMARVQNHQAGADEELWDGGATVSR